ncbi:hypothetical protein ACQPTN_22150 [Bradyrhizobium sp. 13971]
MALQWSDARDGRIAWRQVSKDGIGPLLTVEDATALNAEPPVYVDAAAGLIGPIGLNLPERLVAGFCWRLRSHMPMSRKSCNI